MEKVDFLLLSKSLNLEDKIRFRPLSLTIRLPLLVSFLFFLSCVSVIAASGTFPNDPFNGLQINYSISGASLGVPEDTYDYTTSRRFTGFFSGGNLVVQGSVTAEWGYYADLSVSVQAGGASDSYQKRVELKTSESFNVSVAIPQDAESAAFSITLIGSYNAGSRTLVVSGTLSYSDNLPPEVSLSYSPSGIVAGVPVSFTAAAIDPDGDVLSFKWYLNGNFQGETSISVATIASPIVGTHTIRVVASDGKGGEGEDTISFTVNEVKPYVIAPGFNEGDPEQWIAVVHKIYIDGQEVADAETTKLYQGSRIKTGPGVEIVIRYSNGAQTRVKVDGDFEIKKAVYAKTSQKVVFSRLYKGICEFYWPPGYEGAKKFEVSTHRANTSIKGTTFTLSHLNDITTVLVAEGEVEFTNLVTGAVDLVRAGTTLSTRADDGYVEGFYNYYIPYYSSANGSWTGLGVTNRSSSSSALVRAMVYDSSGNLLATESVVLPASGQDSFPVALQLNQSGWLRVNSFQPLSGLAFLGTGDALSLMADIPFAADLSTSMVIPHIAQDDTWDTNILICNPNDQAVSVNLQYVDIVGVTRGSQSYTIPAFGSGEYALSVIFSAEIPLAGSVEISSPTGLAAFAIYSNRKSGGSYYAGINADGDFWY